MRKVWGIAAGIFLVTAFIFSPARQYAFVTLDDGLHTYQNAYIKEANPSSVRRFWSSPFQGLYIPVTYTSWWLETRLGKGPNPEIYHSVNILLHAANASLCFFLLYLLFGNVNAAVFGALLFAVHPLQVESVAWISARKDTLSVFFSLAAWLTWLKLPRARWIGFFLFVLACLSKPLAIMLPVMIFAVEIGLKRRSPREVSLSLLPWFFVSVGIGWVTKSAQPDAIIQQVPPIYQRLVIACDAIAFYLGKLVVPWNLSLNYGRTPGWVTQRPELIVWLVIPFLVTLLLMKSRRRAFHAMVLTLFLAPLLPTLGLVPFYYQKYSTVADRFIYLSLLAPAFLLVDWLSRQKRAAYLAFASVLIILTGVTVRQLPHWTDNLGLLAQMVRVSPTAENHYSFAYLLSQKLGGVPEGDSRDQMENAVFAHYQRAISLDPVHANARNNLGLLLAGRGHHDIAVRMIREAIVLDPLLELAHNNLGVVLASQQKYDDAIASFQEAMNLNPRFIDARFNLGLAFEKKSHVTQALTQYREVLKLNPRHASAKERLNQLSSAPLIASP